MESWYCFSLLKPFEVYVMKLVLTLLGTYRDPCLSSWELPQFHFLWLCCSGRERERVVLILMVALFCFLTLPHSLSLQSLLAALGSIQFVSNIAFAYVVLNKMVTVKYVNIFTVICNLFLFLLILFGLPLVTEYLLLRPL